MSRKSNYTKAQLEAAVAESSNLWQVLKRLVKVPRAGHYPALRKRILDWGISTSHFAPNSRGGWNRGLKVGSRLVDLENILKVGTVCHSSSRLKARLVGAGIKKDICELCGLGPSWNGRPLTLQLDHINGVRTDNTIGNLRCVCPNCHSQTETFCRTKPMATETKKVEVRDCDSR